MERFGLRIWVREIWDGFRGTKQKTRMSMRSKEVAGTVRGERTLWSMREWVWTSPQNSTNLE